MTKYFLELENGKVFEGLGFGASSEEYHVGELVFNTSHCGYQEIATDPSYAGQIITYTAPHLGNYGIEASFDESTKMYATALISKDFSINGMIASSDVKMLEWLSFQKKLLISGIETRELVRILTKEGAQKAVISKDRIDRAQLKKVFDLPDTNWVSKVSGASIQHYQGSGKHVVLWDFGSKKAILKNLLKQNFSVTIVPWNTDAKTISEINPDGIVLSNGPGDPSKLTDVLPHIKAIQEKYPMLGICLGHQLIALANGAKTYKLKFGHRGGNHPVRDLVTGKCYLTAQNHGYAVDEKSLIGTPLEVRMIQVNDHSNEGLMHKSLPCFSVQFHPEAAPGPLDSQFVFDEFKKLLIEPNSFRAI
jgi:carbamoyl-phosphate synthase small subunit